MQGQEQVILRVEKFKLRLEAEEKEPMTGKVEICNKIEKKNAIACSQRKWERWRGWVYRKDWPFAGKT